MIFTALYENIPVQTVLTGQSAVFTNGPIACGKGLIMHRAGSSVFTLRGPGCACNQCFARYKVNFTANIAVAAGGAPANGATVAIALNGEALGGATAIVTPAAAGEFNNVSVFTYIDVPRGCCSTVSIQNAGTEGIDIENAALGFERVA